jgi:hypothetical protein
VSNKLRFIRRLKRDSDGRMHSDGYDVYGGEGHLTRLGKVEFRAVPAEWVALYGGRAVGTHSTRQGAGDRLRIEHERIWGPIGGDGRKLTDGEISAQAAVEAVNAAESNRPQPNRPQPNRPQPNPWRDLAVVDGDDLAQLYRAVGEAVYVGRPVRFTVDNGLKWDDGNGWTPPKGRPADETGH